MTTPADFITCEGCNEEVARSWWTSHWCNNLIDRDGKLVKLGDVLQYSERPEYRTYTVVEIWPTFTKGGTCYGIRRGDKLMEKLVIRPRLMRKISE